MLGPFSLNRDPIAFRGDAHRLYIGRGRESHDQEYRARPRRHRQPVAPHELRCAVGHRVATGDDGLAVQIPLDIAGHLLRGCIAALGLLAHRHDHHVVQVAVQCPPQARGTQVARLGDAACFRRIVCADGVTRQRRVFFTDRALDIREAHGRNDEGAGSGQQFVQQDAQHVDVARSGDRLSTDLFGARMVGRHDADVGMRNGQSMAPRLTLIQ